MKSVFTSLKAAPVTILLVVLLFSICGAWFQSSRFSERHLIYVGAGTVEVFSASSLIRISLVPGRVGDFGGKTFYRQKNARGKMLIRPVYPQFANRSGIPETTFGYWHLGIACLIALGLSANWEVCRLRQRLSTGKNGAEGRN